MLNRRAIIAALTGALLVTTALAAAPASGLVGGSRADLSVLLVKPWSPAAVQIGEPATWRVDVRNAGPAVAASPTVTVIIPADLRFMGVAPTSGNGWSCTADGGTVTCALGYTLPPSASAPELLLTTEFDATRPAGPATSLAVVSSPTADPDPANNSSTATVSTSPLVDLGLAMRPTAFTPGGSGRYSLLIDNRGPSAFSGGIVVLDTLPAGVTYSGVSSPAGGPEFTCGVSGQQVTCTTIIDADAPLIPEETLGFALDVAVAPGTSSTVVNEARVYVSPLEVDYTTNTVTSVSDPAVSSDLWIEVEPVTPVAASGRTMSWAITYGNKGPSPLSGRTTIGGILPRGTWLDAGAVPEGWVCESPPIPPVTGLSMPFTCVTDAPIPAGGRASLVVTSNVWTGIAGDLLPVFASIYGANEACVTASSAQCLNNTAVSGVWADRGSVQLVKNIVAGNDMRTGNVVLTLNCPANAASPPPNMSEDPVIWPVTITLGPDETSDSTGNLPIWQTDTCEVQETSTGAPEPPDSPIPAITPVWGGVDWVSGARTLQYGSSAALTATSSTGSSVTTTVGGPCRYAGGQITASTGTGSCPVLFGTAMEPRVVVATEYNPLFASTPAPAAPARTGIARMTVKRSDSTGHASLLVTNEYRTQSSVETLRTVSLAKAALPLSVTGIAAGTPLPRTGTTTVVSRITTPGAVTVGVRCAPRGVRATGDLRYCTWKYNASTGQVSVTTRGWRNVVVTATITAAPAGSRQAGRYTPSTWSRSWTVK